MMSESERPSDRAGVGNDPMEVVSKLAYFDDEVVAVDGRNVVLSTDRRVDSPNLRVLAKEPGGAGLRNAEEQR